MYALLFLILAPLIAGLLLLQARFRYRSEPGNKNIVVGVTFLALVIWAAASFVMGLFNFAVTWSLAHARPAVSGHFPEGWRIYGYTVIYAAFGVGLTALVKRIPKRNNSPPARQ
jgi:hypothetical protein